MRQFRTRHEKRDGDAMRHEKEMVVWGRRSARRKLTTSPATGFGSYPRPVSTHGRYVKPCSSTYRLPGVTGKYRRVFFHTVFGTARWLFFWAPWSNCSWAHGVSLTHT